MFEIFVSYSHDDELVRAELVKHLAPLRREKLIENWHDRLIGPGTDFDSEIDQHVESADLFLLLTSASFVNSEYCWSKELARALERRAAGEADVIPVIEMLLPPLQRAATDLSSRLLAA